MKDNLLKEAIADAKMVKAAAIENAMLTLKESFKPQISSMLAAKLRNEEEDYGDDEAMEEQKKLDSSDIGAGSVTVNNPGPKQPSKVASDSSDIENPGQEVETFGEGVDMDGEFDMDAPEQGGNDELDLDMGDDAGEDELDLESIIRELEADLMGGDEEGEEVPAMEGFDDVEAGEEVDGAVTLETLEGGDGDEGVHKSGKHHASTHGVHGGKQVHAVSEDVVDLEEILREMEADDEDMMESSEQIASENVELKRALTEHREVIKLLRNRINEVTLLNNKLMYTTKIFRNFALTEGQKKKVVENFDRATTVREAKLVYSTLVESLGIKSSTPNKVAKKITEGASKTMASTKPNNKDVLLEGDAQVARLQKLAGIRLG